MVPARTYHPSLHRLLLLCCALSWSAGCQRPHPPAAAVPVVYPRVLRTLPHDTLAFTQGLLLHEGILYESTGAPQGQQSSLRRIDPATGAVLERIALDTVFAEGIASIGNTLVQLTWKHEYALVYTLPGLTPAGTVRYRGEGWGLTSTATTFIMSNGSDTLTQRNRAFEPVRRLAVRLNGQPLTNLNELQYARGVLYANVWYANSIYVISPATGEVIQEIDCSELVSHERPASIHHVLNGIAWDRSGDTFYLTGKNWRTLFEVAIPAPPSGP